MAAAFGWLAAIILAGAGGFILTCAGICTGDMHAYLFRGDASAARDARFRALVGLAIGTVMLALALVVRP